MAPEIGSNVSGLLRDRVVNNFLYFFFLKFFFSNWEKQPGKKDMMLANHHLLWLRTWLFGQYNRAFPSSP